MKRFLPVLWCSVFFATLLLSGAAAFAEVPDAPQNLGVWITFPENPDDPYVATLSWEGSDEAEGYRIYVKTLGEDWSGGQFEPFAETTETSYTPDDLDIGSGAFAFFVKAFNADGESAASNTVSSVCGRQFDGDLSEYNGTGMAAIISVPGTVTLENNEYRYDANTIAEYSSDPTVTVEYNVEGPEGMAINKQTGFMTWVPTVTGTYAVKVIAYSPKTQEYYEQTWNLDVQAQGTTGVEDNNAEPFVSVYPNPTASHLTVNFTAQAGKASLTIADATGLEVMNRSLATIAGANTASLNVGTLASGRYFLRIVSGSRTTVLPFSIVR